MKAIFCKILIVSVVMLTSATSCRDVFDVVPFDRLDKEKAYATERSVNAILNGLYLQLPSSSLYGSNLSVGMIEVMAQHYVMPTNHTYYYSSILNYQNETSRTRLQQTWDAAYRLIASCNEFLYEIEKREYLYLDAHYRMYRGEALAIRTLLHFDMLRLFGPIYQIDHTSLATPYYDVSSNDVRPLLSSKEMMEKLFADIEEAMELLKDDPILETGLNMEDDLEEGFFTSYRNFRMNIYALSILKARMHLHIADADNKALAYEIATQLLDNINPTDPSQETNFTDLFSFVQSGDALEEHVFFPEVIFGLMNSQRDALYTSHLAGSLSASAILAGGEAFYDKIYDDSSYIGGVDPSIRSTMWQWDSIKELYLFLRYTTDRDTYKYRTQCMFRIGEVYLIAAEAATDLEIKRQWIEEFRVQRGHNRGNADGLYAAGLNALVDKEFTMETYGEGQYFFFAKRNMKWSLLNQTAGTTSLTVAGYSPPMPESETNYRPEQE